MILLKKISVFTVLVMLLTTSCSKKTLASAEVNYVSGNEGTIVMRSIGEGTNQQEAIADAEKRSINVILFRGLPESSQKIALIGTNESEEMDKHKDYFDTFYNKLDLHFNESFAAKVVNGRNQIKLVVGAGIMLGLGSNHIEF